MKITDTLRRRFAEEYTLCHSAATAMRRANTSVADEHCGILGARLLRDARTRDLINEFMQLQADRCLVTRDMVVAGLLREANYYGVGSTHTARVNAWTQLGKTHELNLFKDSLNLRAEDLQPVVNVHIRRNKDDGDVSIR